LHVAQRRQVRGAAQHQRTDHAPARRRQVGVEIAQDLAGLVDLQADRSPCEGQQLRRPIDAIAPDARTGQVQVREHIAQAR